MKESSYDPYREQKRLEKIWRILFRLGNTTDSQYCGFNTDSFDGIEI